MAVVIEPCEVIHQQYTGVLTLLQGTTGFDHTPSWCIQIKTFRVFTIVYFLPTNVYMYTIVFRITSSLSK